MYIHTHLILVDYKFINDNNQEYVFPLSFFFFYLFIYLFIYFETFEYSKHLVSRYWVFF